MHWGWGDVDSPHLLPALPGDGGDQLELQDPGQHPLRHSPGQGRAGQRRNEVSNNIRPGPPPPSPGQPSPSLNAGNLPAWSPEPLHCSTAPLLAHGYKPHTTPRGSATLATFMLWPQAKVDTVRTTEASDSPTPSNAQFCSGLHCNERGTTAKMM